MRKMKMYMILLEKADRDLDDALDAIAEECAAEGKPSHGADYDLRSERAYEDYEREIDDILFDARCNGIIIRCVKGKWKGTFGFCNWSRVSGTTLRFV